MSEHQLSPVQAEVVRGAEPRLTVRAAAGSGKTRVLAERYLRTVVEEGLSPDRILTITFTRKAAADMKRRIVRRLQAEGLPHQAQIAETGPIQTIHSFCERLLRENALEAGLDPDFEVLSGAQDQEIRLRAIRQALAEGAETFAEAGRLVTAQAGLSEYKQGFGLAARLEGWIGRVLTNLRGTSFRPDDLWPRYRSAEAVAQTWRSAVLELPEFEGILTVADESLVDIAQRLRGGRKRESENRWPKFLPDKVSAEGEAESAQATAGIMQIALMAWERLEGAMDLLQAFDFCELERRAVELIEGSSVALARVREAYPAVLVDEAQDVNPLQYRLIDRVIDERELMVGDPQQAIYGFRLADRELFMGRIARTPTRSLDRNYRSVPGILNFVDQIFGGVWGEAYEPMAPPREFDLDSPSELRSDGVELWRMGKNDARAVALGVGQLIAEGVDPGSIAVLARFNDFAQQVARELDALSIANRVMGGTERFYLRMEVRDLANALCALADPTDDMAMLALLRGPMVGLSLDAIVLLGASSGVYGRLAGFDAPTPDDAERLLRFLEWFEEESRGADRLPAWEVIATLFRRTPFLRALAALPNRRQALANVRKLLVLATRDPGLGPREYAAVIRRIQSLRHKEGDAPAIDERNPAVTISTIHKSKGLEFDVVVLGELHLRGYRANALLVDRKAGLVALKAASIPPIAHGLIRHREAQSEQEESFRLLYVGMTRARKRLCLCLEPDSKGQPAQTIVEKSGYRAGLPAGVIERQPTELRLAEGLGQPESART